MSQVCLICNRIWGQISSNLPGFETESWADLSKRVSNLLSNQPNLTNEPSKDRGGPRQCHNAGDLILHGEAGHADAHIQVGPTEIILEI